MEAGEIKENEGQLFPSGQVLCDLTGVIEEAFQQ